MLFINLWLLRVMVEWGWGGGLSNYSVQPVMVLHPGSLSARCSVDGNHLSLSNVEYGSISVDVRTEGCELT